MIVAMFAFETIKLAHNLVELIAAAFEGEVPGTSIINLVTTEGFFVLCETVPGVIGICGRGHAPEIVSVGAGGFSVKNHLDNQDTASSKFAMLVGRGSMSVIANTVVVVN